VAHEGARRRGSAAPEFIASQREAGGVTTTYLEPWRLGVDRFAMAIGGHQLAKPRPVCIVAIGTTLTIDLVDGTGRHLGGAILPSPRLMVDSLLNNTDGIRKRATGGEAGDRSLFARTTRSAIEQGALYAAAATIDRAAEEARWVLDRRPLVLLTGGGAGDVASLIRTPHTAVPDLVLQGLAVLADGSGAGRAGESGEAGQSGRVKAEKGKG
jgi:type III pantothenate kinase